MPFFSTGPAASEGDMRRPKYRDPMHPYSRPEIPVNKSLLRHFASCLRRVDNHVLFRICHRDNSGEK